MADEAKKIWVKNPQTGEVLSISTPDEIHAAQANQFVNATQEEADKAYRDEQLEGGKGMALAAGAGVASAVPFARNLVRHVAPKFGADLDEAAEKHPWIHGATELATFVAGGEALGALKGAGAVAEGAEAAAGLSRVLPAAAEKAIIAEGGATTKRAAIAAVEEHLAKSAVEAAGETGIAKAVPSLSQRVLGRLPDAAKNAQVGLATGAIQLTNEKDLPHTPEALASHVMSTLFWNTAGAVVGGEAMHGLIKAASPVVRATSKAMGKGGEALDNLAAALEGGNGEALVGKSKRALQEGLDAVDALGHQKTIDKAMEQARKKLGDDAMGDLDAARITAETAYEDARANVLRQLGYSVDEGGKSVRKISMDKVARALRSDSREDVLKALQDLHAAGKKLQDFHEQLSQAGATGLEDLAGKTKQQVQDLLHVQDAMKKGIVEGEKASTIDEVMKGGIGAGIAGHFGHMLLGKAYLGVKLGKAVWHLAPAEFKAARLAQLARLAEGVDGHLERVAAAAAKGGGGKYAAPAASLLSADELRKMRDDVQQKMSNPQLAMEHIESVAGVLNEFAPDTFGQIGLQYGEQLKALAGILQWPELPGPYSPQWMPSHVERTQMSTKVAIVKDPKVFEAKLAKGTATPAEAAVYKQAHPQRAQQLASHFLAGMRQGAKADKGTLKAMTAFSILGLGPARASYSQQTLQGVQGLYSQRANQQGGPGSRGGTGGAKALTASQMISLPGQRVSNRPIK